ncbi:MAG: sulfatase-like hydrolase/transferase, partial [Verrucomicrobiales bacterium]|nr:sulfatase-like hydrolase/transferase [Verrucomicrobiales bacterium]
GNDYFDDTYFRNGRAEKFSGYCTDVWLDEMLRFIGEDHGNQPFFIYLPTNAMHSPFTVVEEYSKPYLEMGVPEQRAIFYGMIANFDENLGRLLDTLSDSGLDQNTLVIFMGDNGTAAGSNGKGTKDDGFNAGMRGKKGSAYEGGHRVACFAHWPARLQAGRVVDKLTSHRDWMPTLIDLCDLKAPEGVSFDGQSIAPLLLGTPGDWPDRTLFIERQPDDIQPATLESNAVPFAVLTERWRMVNGELYDIQKDPAQSNDVGSAHPEVVAELFTAYEEHYADVMGHGGKPVSFLLGAEQQNPTHLTVRDWHPIDGAVIWHPAQLADDELFINGWWAVEIARPGRYAIRLSRYPEDAPNPMGANSARLRIGALEESKPVNAEDIFVTFEVDLPAGPAKLETWLTDSASGKDRGAYHLRAERIGDTK